MVHASASISFHMTSRSHSFHILHTHSSAIVAAHMHTVIPVIYFLTPGHHCPKWSSTYPILLLTIRFQLKTMTEMYVCILILFAVTQVTAPSSSGPVDICSYLNRTGALCGTIPQQYMSAYSYNFTCMHCHHVIWNWFRYIMAAYLPLTLFHFIVLFFKGECIVSGSLHAVV